MFDIVGDIHGHAAELKRLLDTLGYQRHGEGYRHPDRKVVFVGDFVDRGPAIAEVIAIARTTVQAGDGFAVMGNHEYNAIAFDTPVPRVPLPRVPLSGKSLSGKSLSGKSLSGKSLSGKSLPGKRDAWFREHSAKNLKQHRSTLDQLSPGELADAIAWFKTLPVALELDGIRVVHAAWRDDQIAVINRSLETLGRFTPEFLAESECAGSELSSDLNHAVEDVLKGPELTLPSGLSIVDKAGHERNTVRVKWYEELAGRSYRGYHFGSDQVPDVAIESSTVDGMTGYPADAPPVFVGHYWLTGTPVPLAANVACTDYSVAKDGKLVAYRWDGERVLSADKFWWID